MTINVGKFKSLTGRVHKDVRFTHEVSSCPEWTED